MRANLKQENRSRTKVPFKLEMSNELESDMVVNLESLEAMVLVTMRPRPSRQVRQTRIEDHVSEKIMFQKTVRFRRLLPYLDVKVGLGG